MTVMVKKDFSVLFCSSLCAPEALNLTVYVPLFMFFCWKPLNLSFSVRNNQPRLQRADSHDSSVNSIMFVKAAPTTVLFFSAIYLPKLKSNKCLLYIPTNQNNVFTYLYYSKVNLICYFFFFLSDKWWKFIHRFINNALMSVDLIVLFSSVLCHYNWNIWVLTDYWHSKCMRIHLKYLIEILVVFQEKKNPRSLPESFYISFWFNSCQKKALSSW